jgi:DNA replication initiation complex subunit (GINS family)
MLTFEMIRELERQEKTNRKLQKLPENLNDEIRDYIKRKEKIPEKSTADIMELENVKNTIRRFFELREKKIAEMALVTARTGLPVEFLSKEEEKIFYQIVGLIKDYRELFFSDISREIEEKKPEVAQQQVQEKEKSTIYRVKKEMQEFVGPDMKTYRLVRGEIVNLPKPLNDLLLKEGVIEELHE